MSLCSCHTYSIIKEIILQEIRKCKNKKTKDASRGNRTPSSTLEGLRVTITPWAHNFFITMSIYFYLNNKRTSTFHWQISWIVQKLHHRFKRGHFLQCIDSYFTKHSKNSRIISGHHRNITFIGKTRKS